MSQLCDTVLPSLSRFRGPHVSGTGRPGFCGLTVLQAPLFELLLCRMTVFGVFRVLTGAMHWSGAWSLGSPSVPMSCQANQSGAPHSEAGTVARLEATRSSGRARAIASSNTGPRGLNMVSSTRCCSVFLVSILSMGECSLGNLGPQNRLKSVVIAMLAVVVAQAFELCTRA